jgi:hypothetical protein
MDQETRAAYILINAIIARAIMDTFLPSVLARLRDGRQKRLMDSDAQSALEFLFDPKNPYLLILDIDPPTYQKKFLEKMYSDKPSVDYSEANKRAFRLNWKMWQQIKAGEALGQNDIHAET